MDLFWVTFCIWCEVGVQPHFFWKSSCSGTSVKETVLSPLNGLSTLVKNQLTISQFWKLKKNQLTIGIWIYFWTLNSIPLVYMSILMPIPHCFDYCSFVISFEQETREGKQDMTCSKHFRKSCDSQGTGSLRWHKRGRTWALVLDKPGFKLQLHLLLAV